MDQNDKQKKIMYIEKIPPTPQQRTRRLYQEQSFNLGPATHPSVGNRRTLVSV
jgi:hypothetical protein